MQTLKDLQEKLFFECKSILRGLSKISSLEELLVKQDLLAELNERVTVLKYLEKNSDFFEDDEKIEIQHNKEDSYTSQSPENLQEEVEEEVIFNNELNEIHESDTRDEIPSEMPETESDDRPEEPALKEETAPEYHLEDEQPSPEIIFDIKGSETKSEEQQPVPEESIESIENEEIKQIDREQQYHDLVAEKENEAPQPEAENAPETAPEILTVSETHVTELFQFDLPPKEETTDGEHHKERKFKLAHIKGLKDVPSLFEDKEKEELKPAEEEAPRHKISEIQPEQTEQGSLKKSNVALNFMEAEKKRPEFRLDLNDKIAFSKVLFGGSQSDLNEAIRYLNSFSTLEDAKEYLSDLYYERNWSKVDEYAQRLWTLVENKFL